MHEIMEYFLFTENLIYRPAHCLMTSMFQIRSLGWLYYNYFTYASRIVTHLLRKVRPQGHRTDQPMSRSDRPRVVDVVQLPRRPVPVRRCYGTYCFSESCTKFTYSCSARQTSYEFLRSIFGLRAAPSPREAKHAG